MKTVSTVFVVILSAALGAPVARAQSGYDLFQKALVKERTEGNVEEAIQLYQRIVREFSGNRALAAKALLEMGQCYEKLGKTEARKAYERVLREYADQSEAATEARTRLAALTGGNNAKGTELATRRLWAAPDGYVLGRTSPDGRYLTYVDFDTGDLALRDLATGEKLRLTNEGSGSPDYAYWSVPSPDGKQIAYSWVTRNLSTIELRVIGTDASKPRLLYSNNGEAVAPVAWSPDGREILAVFHRQDNTNQLAWFSVSDGAPRVLKTLDWRYPVGVSLSPDGRYIVYDSPQQQESENRDIYLLGADASREIKLVEHPSNNSFPFWSPDGRTVLFLSDRTGTTGLWAIRVDEDGRPHGPPELVKPDMERIRPLGFTRKGSLYYGLEFSLTDVYITSLDPATG